jgi:hypothetical protein
MRYPTLNAGRTELIVEQLVAGETVSVDAVAIWRGDGESIDFEVIDNRLEEIRDDFESRRGDRQFEAEPDRFEGELAVLIDSFFSAVPIPILDDPGFWRYLSVTRFWWFISWREQGPISRGNVATYTSSQKNTEQIPLRLYLRARALRGTQAMELAHLLRASSDFWRSHVLRVRTGTAPRLTQAFAEMQLDEESRLSTDSLRVCARRLNRTWTNVNLALLETEEVRELLNELKE